MFHEITYYPVFGIPLIVYGGIFTLLMFFATGVVAFATRKGYVNVPVKWHFWLAYLALAVGIMHALGAMLNYV